MHSIKNSFKRLKFMTFALLAVLIVITTEAQQGLDFELPAGGDIVLQNILPDSTDITVRVGRVTFTEDSFSLTGSVFIGAPPDAEEAQEDAKIADIDMTLASVSYSDKPNGDNRHISASLYNIRRSALRDLGFLPIDLPDTQEADNLRVALSFELDGEGSIGPIGFSAAAPFLDVAGQLALGSDFTLTAFRADIRRLSPTVFFALGGDLLAGEDLQTSEYFSGQAILQQDESQEIQEIQESLENLESLESLDIQAPRTININLQAENITITAPTLFPEAQVIKSPNAKAIYDFDRQIFVLEVFDFGIREARFNASAKLTPDQDGSNLFEMRLSMFEGLYQASDLASDWPLPLAPLPRRWVIDNVHRGYADGLQLALKGKMTDGNAEVSDFSADMQTKDGEFSYWGAMPNITTEEILINFTKDDLTVSTDSGMTADMRDISAAVNIAIPQSAGNDSLAVATIDIQQNFDKLEALLNRPRVALLDRLGIPPQAKAGEFIGHAELGFVLKRALTQDQIDFNFSGTLKDFSSPETPFGVALPVSAENLNLTGSRQEIEVTSEHIAIGELNGKFRWLVDLQEADTANRYSITPVLDENFWNMSMFRPMTDNLGGIALSEYISGEAEIGFSFPDNDQGFNEMRLDVDLTATELHVNELNLHKPKDTQGHLSVDVKTRDSLLRIKDFIYRDSDNVIALAVDIDGAQEYALQKLEMEKFLTPTSDFSATAIYQDTDDKPAFNIEIQAEKLDLVNFFNYALDIEREADASDVQARATAKDYGINPQAIDDLVSPDFEVTLTAKALIDAIDEEAEGDESTAGNAVSSVRDVDFYAKYENSKLAALEVTAEVEEANGYINYHADSLGKNLHGQMPNVGALLRHAGLSDSMQGGAMQIDMHATTPEEPLSGDFSVLDFHLRRTPIFSRLLQLVSAAEAGALLTGKGLHFTSWKGNIAYGDETLSLSENNLRGTTIGLSMQGSINGKDSQVKLRGTLVPFYWISSNIAKLPLLNRIFGNNMDNALFGFRYGIDGPFDDISVWVNPISILTPGGLKAIFDRPSPESQPQSNEDN